MILIKRIIKQFGLINNEIKYVIMIVIVSYCNESVNKYQLKVMK